MVLKEKATATQKVLTLTTNTEAAHDVYRNVQECLRGNYSFIIYDVSQGETR